MIALNQIPNILTVIRIILIVPFAISVYQGAYQTAMLLFFIAGLSDGVDGFLARQFNWKSRFGAIADPLADKLLLVTAYVMLAWTAQIPLELTLGVLARDLIIVFGALIYHFFIGQYEIKPSWLGKTCTLVQIVYALAVIVKLAGFPMSDDVVDIGVWVVALVTAVSGIHYVGLWSYRGHLQLKGKSRGDNSDGE